MSQHLKQHTVTTAFQDKFTGHLYSVGGVFASDDPERIAFLQDEGYLGAEVETPAEDNAEDNADNLLAQSADKVIKALTSEEKEEAALRLLLDQEKAGKNRKTVTETLEAMLAKLQKPADE